MEMIEHNYIIEKSATLFRYDLTEPPVNWDSNYKSVEYAYVKWGKTKNAAKNFFFFNNEKVTISTAEVAVSNYKEGDNDYWLTTATVLRNLNLFCLFGDDIFFNLLKLYDSEINVFTDDFLFNFGTETKSFLILKKALDEYIKCDVLDFDRKIELRNELVQPFVNPNCPFGLLGQTLSDFNNGIAFTKLLAENGYDGYTFDESLGGHTICLINDVVMRTPTALSKPKREKKSYK